MKKILKRVLYTVIVLVLAVCLAGLVLAYLPTDFKIANKGIAPQQAAYLRQHYTGTHNQFATPDGDTIFLWRWNPDTITPAKKDIAILLLHGITAYGGAYTMAGVPIAKGGYTVFGLDYRGHGLSSGNRGDSPGKDKWIGDLANGVKYIKTLGFTKVVVLGHSLGVASAICTADTVPNEIAGLILLSGAYEGRKGLSKPMSFFQQAKLVSSAIFRPSYRAVEYYRKGMVVTKDTLFNFRYTPRFLTMLDVKKLRVPATLNIPVLVGVGDKDEVFEIDKVRDFYNLIPGNKKQFLIMKNATHAKIPVECWEEVVAWLDGRFVN